MAEPAKNVFIPGLVSVSFRRHTPQEIIEAAKANGLKCIEWGGDVHVPPGDADLARRIGRQTEEAGLFTCSYGSYFRLGCDSVEAFDPVLETAVLLNAPVVRIWGYDRKLSDVPAEKLDALVQEARRIAFLANKAQITVCLECHPGTVTEDYQDALQFIRMVNEENFRMYWQPNQHRDDPYNLAAAEALAPYVHRIHAFQWSPDQRFPLAVGSDIWKQYLSILPPCPVLLEFMPDGKIETLATEASTLHRMLPISWL